MHTLPFSQYPFRKGLQSFYTCTFLDMHTPSIGLYPSREGHWSFYPRISAHFWTWKLRPLARITLRRGTRVFIHGSLHISGHGNSIHWPISLQGGALEFLSMDPCISGHGNSIHWPISLQGGAPEFLSTDPCTFLDMETPSIGPYPSREGHQSFYPRTPAHFQTWKLHPLAHIPPGRGTRVFIHEPLLLRSGHISLLFSHDSLPYTCRNPHDSFLTQDS